MLTIYYRSQGACTNNLTEVSNLISPKIKSLCVQLLYPCEGHLYIVRRESSYRVYVGSKKQPKFGVGAPRAPKALSAPE